MGNLSSLFPSSTGCFNTTFSADACFWRVGFTLPRDKRDFNPSPQGGRIFRDESLGGRAEHVCVVRVGESERESNMVVGRVK